MNWGGLFKAPLNPSVVAFNPAVVTPSDTDTVNLTSNTVTLDDGLYPDTWYGEDGDQSNDLGPQEWMPGYAQGQKPYSREFVFTPETLPSYAMLNPAPGSQDLIAPRDSNSVPGTAQLNYIHGPVTGNSMDVYQEGNRQELLATPPGTYGPVVGGQDYSSVVAAATWQEAFAGYSNDAASQTIVGAI